MLRRVVRVGLVAGIVLAGSAVLAAEVSITTPDSDGDVGWGSSLVLDVDGHPVIAYQDRTNRTLKVMHCNDPYCAGGDESITTPDPEGGGYSPSIVLDAVGHPVIAHARGGLVATATRVVRCNDPDCAGGDESVTAHHLAGLGDVSLVLDAAGNPVLAQTELESDLYLMRCNDPNCAGGDESITTPAGRGGDEVSLTLDALDNPVFAYGGSGPTLGIVHCNDPNCAGGDESIGSPSLGITFDVAEIGSIVLDAAGNPVISYVESISSFDPLRVLHCNDPNCVGGDESSTTPVSCDGANSLELDPAGNPVIALNRFGEGLGVLHCDDPDCAEGGDALVIADPTADPRSLDLVLDAAGNPVISYYDSGGRDLKVAHCGDAMCLSDLDGDGFPDDQDAFPADPSEWADTDGDGVGDNADLDDDGDGQSDADEVSCGSDPLDAESVSPDADADGVPDCVDPDVVTTTTEPLPTTTTPVTTTEPPVAVLPATGRAVDGALWRTTLALGAGVTLVAVSRRAGGSVSS